MSKKTIDIECKNIDGNDWVKINDVLKYLDILLMHEEVESGTISFEEKEIIIMTVKKLYSEFENIIEQGKIEVEIKNILNNE